MELYSVDIRPTERADGHGYRAVVYRDGKAVHAVLTLTIPEFLFSLSEAFKAGKF